MNHAQVVDDAADVSSHRELHCSVADGVAQGGVLLKSLFLVP